ncbi:MAG: YoaK family protein [Terriglobales bacterium]
MAGAPASRGIKAFAALSLALAAGSVDIIGYVSFGQLFTAHLTGDTVHLGQNLFDARWEQAAKAGAIILAFFAGSIIGRAMIEVASRLRVRSVATATLLLEAVLIGAVAVSGGSRFYFVFLLAVAMGVQTATLTRVGSLTVHTTFVTGMINKLAQLVSHVSFLTYDAVRGSGGAKRVRVARLREARFIFGVWFCYLAGAALGSAVHERWDVRALLLPVVVVLLLTALDQAWPLSVEEEHDQSER